jgi:hypothetical protein
LDKCDELCARYAAGETAQALADEYGVSKPAVLTLLRARNVTVRGRKLSRDQIAQTVREYEAGKSIAQIAKILEFHPAAIWRALKIPRRGQPNQGFPVIPKNPP